TFPPPRRRLINLKKPDISCATKSGHFNLLSTGSMCRLSMCRQVRSFTCKQWEGRYGIHWRYRSSTDLSCAHLSRVKTTRLKIGHFLSSVADCSVEVRTPTSLAENTLGKIKVDKPAPE